LTAGFAEGRKNYPVFFDIGRVLMANHLTPYELADHLHMDQQEVIGRCVEMGIPIFHGRIDRTLFEASMRNLSDVQQGKLATDLRH
jgi:hypothetical protein